MDLWSYPKQWVLGFKADSTGRELILLPCFYEAPKPTTRFTEVSDQLKAAADGKKAHHQLCRHVLLKAPVLARYTAWSRTATVSYAKGKEQIFPTWNRFSCPSSKRLTLVLHAGMVSELISHEQLLERHRRTHPHASSIRLKPACFQTMQIYHSQHLFCNSPVCRSH